MNILIVKLSAIGDVVMALPFLAALRRAFPRARLTWLVEEAAADLLKNHPLLDRTIVSRRRTWWGELKQGRFREAFGDASRFWRELRRERYDLVVDLQGLLKSGILTILSGGRRRLGFDRTREFSYLFVNEKLPAYDPDRHALERYLDVAVHLGAGEVDRSDFFLPGSPRAAEKAAAWLAGAGPVIVALNPGAQGTSKLWPRKNWRDLCHGLTAEPGISLVLTGGPDEAAFNADLAGGARQVLDLTGRTDLLVLAEIFRSAAALVCPDTGPMHLAAAVGTPVVALFGPTAPWRTGPYGSGHVVLRTNLACSPCFLRSCRNPPCMNSLTPAVVQEAVRHILARREVQRSAH
ncbi:MAG: glycosyltransferase family 9 protein [Thermodesulfobacteriota bacterium]